MKIHQTMILRGTIKIAVGGEFEISAINFWLFIAEAEVSTHEVGSHVLLGWTYAPQHELEGYCCRKLGSPAKVTLSEHQFRPNRIIPTPCP